VELAQTIDSKIEIIIITSTQSVKLFILYSNISFASAPSKATASTVIKSSVKVFFKTNYLPCCWRVNSNWPISFLSEKGWIFFTGFQDSCERT